MKSFVWKECRKARIQLRRRWWAQALVLLAIWIVCEIVVRATGIPLPGSILGLGILLLALELRLFSVAWFRRGASGLLSHLILFLVPAMLAIVNHGELLSFVGLKLLLAVLIGTSLVMVGTAAVVEVGFRLMPVREP